MLPLLLPQADRDDQGVRFFGSNSLILLAPLPGHISNHVPRSAPRISAVTRASARPPDRCLTAFEARPSSSARLDIPPSLVRQIGRSRHRKATQTRRNPCSRANRPPARISWRCPRWARPVDRRQAVATKPLTPSRDQRSLEAAFRGLGPDARSRLAAAGGSRLCRPQTAAALKERWPVAPHTSLQLLERSARLVQISGRH